MDKNTMMRTGVAGAVAAAGLVVGGVAVASADDEAKSSSRSDGQKGGHRGGQGFGVRGTGAVAESLGVSEDKLTAALKAVREDLKGDKSADGERPARGERQAAMAAALATELGISESKVTAALEEQRTERSADQRTALSERLDTAVTAGDLTASDKASVLKAFDAGVLGGGSR